MSNSQIQHFIETFITEDTITSELVGQFGFPEETAAVMAEEIREYILDQADTFDFIKSLIKEYQGDEVEDEVYDEDYDEDDDNYEDDGGLWPSE